jgi:hypothetical protein
MTENEKQGLSLEAFALNVIHAVESGLLPPENTERVLLVLADMVITLARHAKEHDICDAEREAALALFLNCSNLKIVSHVM